eukprot:scaffold2934_cov176-Amphora_coffeaeformis.AAC.5
MGNLQPNEMDGGISVEPWWRRRHDNCGPLIICTVHGVPLVKAHRNPIRCAKRCPSSSFIFRKIVTTQEFEDDGKRSAMKHLTPQARGLITCDRVLYHEAGRGAVSSSELSFVLWKYS